MSIWTRISEALALVGDSIGGFLAKLAKGRVTAPEKSLGFTIGMIALGAKMAKADGLVTVDEVAAFKRVFHVPQAELAAVARVFNLAKQDVTGYDSYARQIARLFHAKAATLESVLDGLFHIAKADGTIHPAELSYLENVAQLFGFGPHDFARIKARHVSAGADCNCGSWIRIGSPPLAISKDVQCRLNGFVHRGSVSSISTSAIT